MASLDRTETTKSEVSRQRILDAAAKTFRDKGYVATRLQDIAEAAGLRAGSIYYHFASKEQILEAVFDIGTTRLRQSVSDAVALLPATASHRDQIFAAARTHLSTLLAQGDYTSANIRNFGQIPEEIQIRHREARQHYEQDWRDLFEAARAAGEVRVDADLRVIRLFLLGGLNWAIEWYRDEGPATIDQIAESCCRGLFDGIAD